MAVGIALEPEENRKAVEIGQHGRAPGQRDDLPPMPPLKPQRQCPVDANHGVFVDRHREPFSFTPAAI
jgi:hypothetical protein